MEQLDQVYAYLDAAYPELEQRLLELLAIRSEQGQAAPGQPFGPGPAQALAYCLDLAREQGFRVADLDGYMGMADLPGQTAEQMGILSHVDVVPAVAEDWTFPPYDPMIDQGMIYGRGALDDKGPLLACAYALLALKECGPPMKRTVRHLIGTNEETGFGCIDHYLAHTKVLPTVGFAPDARFPVVMGEKGLLRWTMDKQWDAAVTPEADLVLQRCTGGVGINSVPAQARIEFSATEAGYRHIAATVGALPEAIRKDTALRRDGACVTLATTGVTAHAAYPEQGDNAVAKLLAILQALDFAPTGGRDFLTRSAPSLAAWGGGQAGRPRAADRYGALTNLLSLIEVGPDQGRFSCDTRYPVTHRGQDYQDQLAAIAEEQGLAFDCWYAMAPLFAPEDSPLIATLLKIFRDHTGNEAPPLVIGSGSYARRIPNFAAFGPVSPEDDDLIHQADERISRDRLLQLSKIYAHAIYALANL